MKKIVTFVFVLLLLSLNTFVQYQAQAQAQKIDLQSPLTDLDSKMIEVSGGTFLMGSDNQEKNETPRPFVYLDDFYISSTEVTQEEYFSVMGENLSHFKGLSLPVEEVSWYDAIVFCNRLSIIKNLEPAYSLENETNPDLWGDIPRLNDEAQKKSKWNKIHWNQRANGYRLPTEAEWEYASLGGLKKNETEKNPDIKSGAWFKDNSQEKSHDCGTKNPNQLGLFDMSGNVWEWCWDWYGHYKSGALENPIGNKKISGLKVRKGGSFKSEDIFCRSANRASSSPEIRGRDLGFRLAKSGEKKELTYLKPNGNLECFESQPIYVLISTYTDEESALHDCKRIQKMIDEKNIETHVLKRFSQNDFFNFDLTAGHFSNIDDAVEFQNQLKSKGVAETKIVDFSSIKNEIKNFDDVAENNFIVSPKGNQNWPNVFSPSVKKCVEILPRNSDYENQWTEVVDFKNLKLHKESMDDFNLSMFFQNPDSKILCASYGEYQDKVTNKNLKVICAVAEKGFYSENCQNFADTFFGGAYKNGSYFISIPEIDVKMSVVQAYGELVLSGNNSDGSVYVLIYAKDFTKEDLESFIKNAYDKNLEKSTGFEKTIFVLPNSIHSQRDFVFLRLNKLKENNPVVEVLKDSELLFLYSGFYDGERKLDTGLLQANYDYAASSIYNLLIEDRKLDSISEIKHPVDLNGEESWYYEKVDSNELTFTTKSFVMTTNSYGTDLLSEDELKDLSLDYNVW